MQMDMKTAMTASEQCISMKRRIVVGSKSILQNLQEMKWQLDENVAIFIGNDIVLLKTCFYNTICG